MIRDAHTGSWIRILTFFPSPPPPGSRGQKALDPGSGTLVAGMLLPQVPRKVLLCERKSLSFFAPLSQL